MWLLKRSYKSFKGVNQSIILSSEEPKAGLLRLKHLTRSRLTALHSLAGLQACSSLSLFAPRNDIYAFTLAEVFIIFGIIGVVPHGLHDDTMYKFNTKCLAKPGDSWGCTAWVIVNENMDYLHCNDLDWNGKTSCK